MTKEKFRKLSRGDIIRNDITGNSYVVESNYGNTGVLITRALLAVDPSEWTLEIKQPLKTEEVQNEKFKN